MPCNGIGSRCRGCRGCTPSGLWMRWRCCGPARTGRVARWWRPRLPACPRRRATSGSSTTVTRGCGMRRCRRRSRRCSGSTKTPDATSSLCTECGASETWWAPQCSMFVGSRYRTSVSCQGSMVGQAHGRSGSETRPATSGNTTGRGCSSRRSRSTCKSAAGWMRRRGGWSPGSPTGWAATDRTGSKTATGEFADPKPLVDGDIGRWLVLDRALWIARGWRPWTRRRHWKAARETICRRILASLDDEGLLPQSYQDADRTPDASALLAVAFGLLGRDDPRAGRLVDAVIARLGAGPYLYRYPPELGPGPGTEGAFLPVSFLAVTALARLGRVDQAGARLIGCARTAAAARGGGRAALGADARQCPSGVEPRGAGPCALRARRRAAPRQLGCTRTVGLAAVPLPRTALPASTHCDDSAGGIHGYSFASRRTAGLRPPPDMETYRGCEGRHHPDMSPCRAVRSSGGVGSWMVVVRRTSDGRRGVEPNPNRTGGHTSAMAPRSMPCQLAVTESS
jgi:hypothetical protein